MVGSGRLSSAAIGRAGQNELPPRLLKLYSEPYWGGEGPIGFTTWGLHTPPQPPPATPPPRPPPARRRRRRHRHRRRLHRRRTLVTGSSWQSTTTLSSRRRLDPRPPRTGRCSPSRGRGVAPCVRASRWVPAASAHCTSRRTDGRVVLAPGTPAGPASAVGAAPDAKRGAPRSARRRTAPSERKPRRQGAERVPHTAGSTTKTNARDQQVCAVRSKCRESGETLRGLSGVFPLKNGHAATTARHARGLRFLVRAPQLPRHYEPGSSLANAPVDRAACDAADQW